MTADTDNRRVFVKRSYGALRFVSGMLFFLGSFLVTTSLIAVLFVFTATQSEIVQIRWFIAGGSVVSILLGMSIIAEAELIQLLIDVENNTHFTAFMAGRARNDRPNS